VDTKLLILSEPEQLAADCIFIGYQGHSALDRFLLGSISAAVAARAHCSVEVVRQG
jgi:nucleotide-binding universal stress UspA family protein